MTLTHPKTTQRPADKLALQPLFGLENAKIPRHELPDGEMAPDLAYEIIHDELMLDGNARLNVATFVTTCDGAAGRDAHDRVLRQEHDRQGRVPADGRDRGAVREHARPALACARCRAGDGVLDDGLERGGDARRPRAETALAEAAEGRGQAGRQAEPRDGHQRPGLLGEVRQLLGRRDAARADGGRPLPPVGRGGRQAMRREHDRRRRDPRLDVRRLLRAGGRRSARRSTRSRPRPASTSPSTWTARPARSSRRSSIRSWSGTSACRASPRSTHPATSTGSSTRASAGSSGATPTHFPRT